MSPVEPGKQVKAQGSAGRLMAEDQVGGNRRCVYLCTWYYHIYSPSKGP